ETIDIGAEKEGYDDGSLRLRFIVKETGDTQGDCPPTLDGVIDPGEYEFTATFGGGDFKLHWTLEGDTITAAMEGNTDGWVAIGLDPSDRMKDADMIFGSVSDSGTASILDCYSTGTFGPHPSDTELGGTSDVLCYGGEQSGGKTVIEFKRLLFTGDDKDKEIPSTGELTVIWAIGQNDDFESQHSDRGYGEINLAEGTYSETEVPSLWLFHASLLTVGFLLMLAGVIVAKFQKKKRWRIEVHKWLGVSGSIISLAGIILGFVMVTMTSGEHFRVPHAYLGVLAAVFIILSPVLGIAQFKIKKNKARVRMIHRWVGRIAVTAMLINILAGLSLVGII
ncbi:MAG: hypothetical protein JSW28_08950, partial [Thermoplasmata archaeon]